MKVYVASSWRNARQPAVVELLRAAGHEVYDFRNPGPGDKGFGWTSIDPAWETWTPAAFRAALDHPTAIAGFTSDFAAMRWADAFVLVLPCGRSAHLEAGWATGKGKPTFVLIEEPCEPELMYRQVLEDGGAVCVSTDELLVLLGAHRAARDMGACEAMPRRKPDRIAELLRAGIQVAAGLVNALRSETGGGAVLKESALAQWAAGGWTAQALTLIAELERPEPATDLEASRVRPGRNGEVSRG